MKAATTTLDRNETTKTLSSKIPSRIARIPPKTASSAAMTAMGRYAWSPSGDRGVQQQAGDDADDQSDDGDHRVTSGVGVGVGVAVAPAPGRRASTTSVLPRGTLRSAPGVTVEGME